MDIDSAWSNFCENDLNTVKCGTLLPPPISIATVQDLIPQCSHLNISTKTKIAYLNYPIDLKTVFWNIPLIQYHEPHIGVVKKQIKFNSTTPEEVEEIIIKKGKYEYVDDFVISQNHKPDGGRSKYKDIRKISIGLCKKDITSYRCKKKSAFYNCFVVIMRILYNDLYKEIHVKVFNTGKLEIPGIKDADMLDKVLHLLVDILSPLVVLAPAQEPASQEPAAQEPAAQEPAAPLKFLDEKNETVMINSNFSCGYYINREKMYKLLKYKYKINSNFDPCSYPGIQCEFYHDSLLNSIQSGTQPSKERSGNTDAPQVTKVSFMVFRTGSVLIVGKCTEEMLTQIYVFLRHIFEVDYDEIKCGGINEAKPKEKTRKLRKKIIMV
jgi:hypothetical protein